MTRIFPTVSRWHVLCCLSTGELAPTSWTPESSEAIASFARLGGERTLWMTFRSSIGNHPLIQKIEDLIKRLTATDATVLVMGESGTGKELVARAIHALSARADHLSFR